MLDPDIDIRGGGGGAWTSRPLDKGGLQFGIKIRGGGPPSSPGSATA